MKWTRNMNIKGSIPLLQLYSFSLKCRRVITLSINQCLEFLFVFHLYHSYCKVWPHLAEIFMKNTGLVMISRIEIWFIALLVMRGRENFIKIFYVKLSSEDRNICCGGNWDCQMSWNYIRNNMAIMLLSISSECTGKEQYGQFSSKIKFYILAILELI